MPLALVVRSGSAPVFWFVWLGGTLIIVPIYAHLNLSCSKRGGAKGVPLAWAVACHFGLFGWGYAVCDVLRATCNVMWAVCDVSVVQPHLYFGLFGWGYATLKLVSQCMHT